MIRNLDKWSFDDLILLLHTSFITTHNFFQFERAFDATADYIWESRNQGKLWKDIKHKYDTPADEE